MAVKQGDSVKVHYIGTLNDGNEFEATYMYLPESSE